MLYSTDSPVEEHDDEEGEDVVPGDVGLRVEGDEDEDAEGGREDEHGHVPREGGVPVRQRVHTRHELQVLHLQGKDDMLLNEQPESSRCNRNLNM